VFVVLGRKCSDELTEPGVAVCSPGHDKTTILRKLELWRHVDPSMIAVMVDE
jgi:hypothetical protein